MGHPLFRKSRWNERTGGILMAIVAALVACILLAFCREEMAGVFLDILQLGD